MLDECSREPGSSRGSSSSPAPQPALHWTRAWGREWSLRRTMLERVGGVRAQVADFPGDGRSDILVFVDTGGSAGCGTYRAFANAGRSTHFVLLRQLCMDQGQILLRHHRVVVSQ